MAAAGIGWCAPVGGQEATAAAPVAAAASAPAEGTRWLAGPPGSALPLEEALAKAKDGDTIELLSGDYPGGWVLENRRLTLRGMAGDKSAVINGNAKPGAARALITVRGGEVVLDNLELRGARANEGSGAGVRLEGGRLTLLRCRFFDNEHGLFAVNDEKSVIVIAGGAFGRAPRVEGGLHHLLNVGRIARLSITGTRFQQGFEGHMIKTRARENLITYNFIHDGLRGGASFAIDIANGGMATVLGNVIGQGADSQSQIVVAYGSESRGWDRNQLLVAHNTFINHGWLPAWFLRVFTKNLPPGVPVVAVNNLLVGGGVFEFGNPGHFEGNRHALRRMLNDASAQAFELPSGSSLRNKGIDPRNVSGFDLSPKAEFDWYQGTKPFAQPLGAWSPGAFQQ